MCHPEALAFVRYILESANLSKLGLRVLEIGSLNVNGSVRSLFPSNVDYVGIDLKAGPGVDRVGFGHEIDDPEGTYDVALSVECLEHDPYWEDTVANMARLVKPGGLVLVTCASTGRPEHGTRRTDPSLSPGTQHVGIDYYQNVAEADFLECIQRLKSHGFSSHLTWYNKSNWDLYFVGIRAGANTDSVLTRLPELIEIKNIRSKAGVRRRLLRSTLRVAFRILSEPRYQDFAVRITNLASRLMDRWRRFTGARN